MATNQLCRRLFNTAAAFAAACTVQSTMPGTRPAAASVVSHWIVSSHAIGLIDGYTGSTALTTNAFDVPSTAEIGRSTNGWVSKRTATYTFYGPVSKSSSFLYALKHGRAGRRSQLPQAARLLNRTVWCSHHGSAHAGGQRVEAPARFRGGGRGAPSRGAPSC
jgi:hypothetical protein